MANKLILVLLLVEGLLAATGVESGKENEKEVKEKARKKEKKPCKITDLQNFHSCLRRGKKIIKELSSEPHWIN